VIERHDDRLGWIVYGPNCQLPVKIERACRQQSRHLGSHQLEPVLPAADLIDIRFDREDVRERNLQATP